jgi:hypothetical protein
VEEKNLHKFVHAPLRRKSTLDPDSNQKSDVGQGSSFDGCTEQRRKIEKGDNLTLLSLCKFFETDELTTQTIVVFIDVARFSVYQCCPRNCCRQSRGEITVKENPGACVTGRREDHAADTTEPKLVLFNQEATRCLIIIPQNYVV